MENSQENPIETLEQIRSIAQSLDDTTILNTAIDADLVHRKVSMIVALADTLLESAKATRQISNHGVSFWIKFCDPLPSVDEKDLIPREWAISSEELDNGTGK